MLNGLSCANVNCSSGDVPELGLEGERCKGNKVHNTRRTRSKKIGLWFLPNSSLSSLRLCKPCFPVVKKRGCNT